MQRFGEGISGYINPFCLLDAPPKLELDSVSKWLLILAVVGCVFMPSESPSGLSGTFYTLGWPTPTMELKVGWIDPRHPGIYIHPYFSINSIINPALWIGIILILRRLVPLSLNKSLLSDAGVKILIVLFYSVTLVFFVFGTEILGLDWLLDLFR